MVEIELPSLSGDSLAEQSGMVPFELPCVSGDSLARDALKALQTKEVGAVVAHVPAGELIYTAAALTEAIRNHGNVPVKTIPGLETVAVPARLRQHPSAWLPLIARSKEKTLSEEETKLIKEETEIIQDVLDSTHRHFVVLESNESTARVMALSDVHARQVNKRVKICICRLDPDHVYLEDLLEGNNTCERDGELLNCS